MEETVTIKEKVSETMSSLRNEYDLPIYTKMRDITETFSMYEEAIKRIIRSQINYYFNEDSIVFRWENIRVGYAFRVCDIPEDDFEVWFDFIMEEAVERIYSEFENSNPISDDILLRDNEERFRRIEYEKLVSNCTLDKKESEKRIDFLAPLLGKESK